jgi:hypothetical protein
MDSLYDSSSVGWFDICATGAADLLLAIQAGTVLPAIGGSILCQFFSKHLMIL